LDWNSLIIPDRASRKICRDKVFFFSQYLERLTPRFGVC
jgi:hypothetical protein